MEVFINGYSQIVKDIENDSTLELDDYKKEFKVKKDELKNEYQVLYDKEKGKIEKETERLANIEYKRRVAAFKVKSQDALLEVKEQKIQGILDKVAENINNLSNSDKSKYLKQKIDQLIKESDEKIVALHIPKGVDIKVDGIKTVSDLDDFGFVLVTEDDAIINNKFDVILAEKEGELRKIIADELF